MDFKKTLIKKTLSLCNENLWVNLNLEWHISKIWHKITSHYFTGISILFLVREIVHHPLYRLYTNGALETDSCCLIWYYFYFLSSYILGQVQNRHRMSGQAQSHFRPLLNCILILKCKTTILKTTFPKFGYRYQPYTFWGKKKIQDHPKVVQSLLPYFPFFLHAKFRTYNRALK